MLKKRQSLADLEDTKTFIGRHIGPREEQTDAMLQSLGYGSMDQLISKVVPETIAMQEPLALGDACSEVQALAELKQLAKKNKIFRSFIGQGYYDTITPPVIQRNILENPAWYTAYTPYQPEISQGRLEALINFQTVVSDLTGMDIANASMLDEGTAAAEAMSLCQRMSKSKSNRFYVDQDCLPQTIEILRTRAEPLAIDIVVADPSDFSEEAFGAIMQYPGATYGLSYFLNIFNCSWRYISFKSK